MSSPIDDDSSDQLKYAPPWARQQHATTEMAGAAPPVQDETAGTLAHAAGDRHHPRDLDLPQVVRMAHSPHAPDMKPLEADPPATWLRAPARPFAGDRAVRELRARMALNPQAVPEPPEFKSSRFRWKSVWRAFGMTVFAASAAFAAVIYLFPEARHVKPARQTLVAPTLMSTPKGDPAPSPQTRASAPSRLIITANRFATHNEPASLGVTLAGDPGHGAVLVSGLAKGAKLSRGTPIGAGTWRVPLSDLKPAKVIPPDNFVGPMEITVALLAADAKVVDKGSMRIEWASDTGTASMAVGRGEMSPSVAPLKRSDLLTLDRDEIEVLVRRGRNFIANGDLAAARLVLRRAANGGDAQAAMLLGTTFDPATFEKLQVIGAAPDPDEARNWYQRAIDLGSVEAERRLAPLARGSR